MSHVRYRTPSPIRYLFAQAFHLYVMVACTYMTGSYLHAFHFTGEQGIMACIHAVIACSVGQAFLQPAMDNAKLKAYLYSGQGPDIDVKDIVLVAVQQGVDQAVLVSVCSALNVYHISLHLHSSSLICKAVTMTSGVLLISDDAHHTLADRTSQNETAEPDRAAAQI